MMPLFSGAMQTLRKAAVARASTLLNIIQQVGASIGTAVMSVILSEALKDRLGEQAGGGIGAAPQELPLEIREPVLQRMDPAAQPIMQLALAATKQTHAEISRLAEDQLADRFRALPGVATVTVNGALQRELSVLLHAEKLREYNISVAEVVNALKNQNTTAPVGKVEVTPLRKEGPLAMKVACRS